MRRLLGLGLLVVGTAVGAVPVSTFLDERQLLEGQYTLVAASAGCQAEPARVAGALAVYQATGHRIARLLGAARPGLDPCRILGVRLRPNVILTAGKTLIRNCLNANTGSACGSIDDFKYAGIGTGTTSPTAADTGCETESTTALNPDNTRATGTQGSSGTTSYTLTAATLTADAAIANTEACILNNATVGSGTGLSHVGYSVINLSSGDSITIAYTFTLN